MTTDRPYEYEPMPNRADVLVVFAHPDDEVTCFGGLIPYCIAQGQTVVAVCMTRGEGGGDASVRDRELRDCLWACGLRHEPVQGSFSDCGYIARGRFESLAWVWQRWGGRSRAAAFVANLYMKYRPRLIFTHHPVTGDYGHPNHMATGWACIDAYEVLAAAADPDAPELQELHIASKSDRAWRIDWDQPCAGFAGESAAQVAARALTFHRSQSASSSGVKPGLAFERVLSRSSGRVVRHGRLDGAPDAPGTLNLGNVADAAPAAFTKGRF